MNRQDIHSFELNRDLWEKKEGETWTEKYPELGTGPIDLQRAVSKEFFESEKEAVFRRNWLYMGRAEQVANPGDYFTQEVEVCNTQLIIVRGKDDKVRAFHNVCPHRGNQLVWKGHPAKETSGRCGRFVCRYHGFAFNLDGSLFRATDAENFFEDQAETRGLAEVPCEVWNGFIFVNLDPDGPKETLRESIGEFFWTGLDGFPFEAFTERYVSVGSCKSNWKTLMDAFTEGYHVQYLHFQTFKLHTQGMEEVNARMQHFGVHGRNHLSVTDRIPSDMYSYEFERMLQAHGAAPTAKPSINIEDLPPAANPTGFKNWGNSTITFFPNFVLQFYYPIWWLTYRFIPIAHDEMRFEITHFLPPTQKFSDLLSHKAFLSIFRDAALQDVNTLEATQRGIETGGVKDGFILQDEEFSIRHFYKTIFDTVDAYGSPSRS